VRFADRNNKGSAPTKNGFTEEAVPRQVKGVSRTLIGVANSLRRSFSLDKLKRSHTSGIVGSDSIPNELECTTPSNPVVYRLASSNITGSIVSPAFDCQRPIIEEDDTFCYLSNSPATFYNGREHSDASSEHVLGVLEEEDLPSKEMEAGLGKSPPSMEPPLSATWSKNNEIGKQATLEKEAQIKVGSQRVKDLVTMLEATFSPTSLSGRQRQENSKPLFTCAKGDIGNEANDSSETRVECPDQRCSSRFMIEDLQSHICQSHKDARWLGDFKEPNIQYWNIRSHKNFEKQRVTWVLTLWKFDGLLFSCMFQVYYIYN